jgi:hypothetical protein
VGGDLTPFWTSRAEKRSKDPIRHILGTFYLLFAFFAIIVFFLMGCVHLRHEPAL